MDAPLDGITVVDFSQFLAGPYASLKLLDLGARVIKVENPDRGDLCRHLYLSETTVAGDSTLFHAINRGKESIALDLKSAEGLKTARRLVTRADVVIQNFRPGVIDRLELGYDAVRELKPGIVYGSISGYGESGDWAGLPGQDLLAQARSGIMWLSGNEGQGPVPVGLPIADIGAGANLAQGLLAALFRHARTGIGTHVETSLLEALLDLQFEFLTTYFNNGETPPRRTEKGSAHGYLAAPYGVYETAEGYLALAMNPLENLAEHLALPTLSDAFEGPTAAFRKREEIHQILEKTFLTRSAAAWETDLTSKGVWCARVLNWNEVLRGRGSSAFEILSSVSNTSVTDLKLVAAPVRLDGQRPGVTRQAPSLNENGPAILREIGSTRG